MRVKNQFKKLVAKLTSTRANAPRGVDLFADVAEHLPALKVKLIFDVGANVGQSAMAYRRAFPQAEIYSFEPVNKNFRKLQENLGACHRVHSFQLAFASHRGRGQMVVERRSSMCFLLSRHDNLAAARRAAMNPPPNVEEVELETLDLFCEDNAVRHLNFLKVDTEGADFEVLKGSESLLAEQSIDLVQVEAGMNCKNDRHVPFEEFNRFFNERDYFLFGIYEQMNEWPTGESHLRRANPVFVSTRVIEANRSACE